MSDWPRVRLDQCAEVVSGATPDTSEASYWDGDICWATPKDLSDLDGTYISDTPRKITRRGLESCAASVLPPESVLFSSRAPIGHVAINTVPMATNQGFKSFVPDPISLDAKFLYHWLRKNRLYLESLGNGATFKEVSKAVVSRIEITLPPLPEQRRIAGMLDKADILRAKRRAAIAQLETLNQSIFLDMFGDPATNPKAWPVSALGALLHDVTNGMTRRRAESDAGQSIVLRLRDIRERWIDFSEINRITLSLEEAQKYEVSKGDLLFIRVNGNPDYVGRCALFPGHPERVYFNDHVMRVRIDGRRVNGAFLTFLLNSAHGKREIARHRKTSAGQHTINQQGLSRIRFPLPPIERQQDFECRVAAVDARKRTNEASLLASDHLFASLQHRAFQGEL